MKATPTPSSVVPMQYITDINLRGPVAVVTRGQSTNLLASITPSDASQKTLQWRSNDRGVAAVSGNGTVTGKGIGYAIIRAASMDGSNKSQSTTVVVKPAKIAMKSMKLTKGDKRKITIKVKKQKGAFYQYQYATNKKVQKSKINFRFVCNHYHDETGKEKEILCKSSWVCQL